MDISKETKHAAPAYAGVLPFVYLRARDVAAAAAISIPTLYRKIADGQLPQGDLIDANNRRWRSDVIAKWLEATSAQAAKNQESAEVRPCIKARRKKAIDRAALAAGGA